MSTCRVIRRTYLLAAGVAATLVLGSGGHAEETGTPTTVAKGPSSAPTVSDAASGTPAADPSPAHTPRDQIQPQLTTFDAGKGGQYSLGTDASTAAGGVKLGYEKVKILCDHLAYWQSPLAGVKGMAIDHSFFFSGPDAADPAHVIFDSRESQLPTIAFRGLMTPVKVDIQRLASDPTRPRIAHLRVLLHHLGDFSGELNTKDGWRPYAGWSDETVAMVDADILPTGLTGYRFLSLVLHSRPAQGAMPAKRARLERLPVTLPSSNEGSKTGSKADASQQAQDEDWSVESSMLTFNFDDEGHLSRLLTDTDTVMRGQPDIHPEVVKPSQPVLDPKP